MICNKQHSNITENLPIIIYQNLITKLPTASQIIID